MGAAPRKIYLSGANPNGKIFLPMVKQFSYDDVASVLTECLRSLAGDKSPGEIRPDVDIFREWGLDSEDGVDLAADIASRLGIQIPDDENPLVEENIRTGRKRARSFKEVVNYVLGNAPAATR